MYSKPSNWLYKIQRAVYEEGSETEALYSYSKVHGGSPREFKYED